MTLKFNGVMEKKANGCPVCGGRKSDWRYSTTKSYYLPSGRIMTCHAGHTYLVSDNDAEFLLSYKYVSNGKEKYVFEVV